VDMRGAAVGRRHRTDEAEPPLAIRPHASSPARAVPVRSRLPQVHERAADRGAVSRAEHAPLENVARAYLRSQRCIKASEWPGAIAERRLAGPLPSGVGQQPTCCQGEENDKASEKASHALQDTTPVARSSGVEHDRDGSVVHERHLHARAEDAARNADTGALERAAEALVKGLGEVRAGSRSEARTIPLSCVLLTSERNRRMETR
jgi:hypothetical protein